MTRRTLLSSLAALCMPWKLFAKGDAPTGCGIVTVPGHRLWDQYAGDTKFLTGVDFAGPKPCYVAFVMTRDGMWEVWEAPDA